MDKTGRPAWTVGPEPGGEREEEGKVYGSWIITTGRLKAVGDGDLQQSTGWFNLAGSPHLVRGEHRAPDPQEGRNSKAWSV